MRRSHVPSARIPPELSPEYDQYIAVTLKYADGTLPPEERAAFEARMRADEGFRQAAEPLIEAWQHPAAMSKEEIAADYEKLRIRLGLPPLDPGPLQDT